MLDWPVFRGVDVDWVWPVKKWDTDIFTDGGSRTDDGTTNPLTVTLGTDDNPYYNVQYPGEHQTLELLYSVVQGYHASQYTNHTIDGGFHDSDARVSLEDDVRNGSVMQAVNKWTLYSGGAPSHVASGADPHRRSARPDRR